MRLALGCIDEEAEEEKPGFLFRMSYAYHHTHRDGAQQGIPDVERPAVVHVQRRAVAHDAGVAVEDGQGGSCVGEPEAVGFRQRLEQSLDDGTKRSQVG